MPCSTLDFKHSRKSRRRLFLKNGNCRADSPSVQGAWQSHRMTGKNSVEMPAAFPAKIHLGYPPGLILYKSYPTQRTRRAQENPNQGMTNSSGKRQLFLSWKLKQETTIKHIGRVVRHGSHIMFSLSLVKRERYTRLQAVGLDELSLCDHISKQTKTFVFHL